MGLRTWLFGLLDRGTAPPEDPTALVEVAVVPLHEAPLLVTILAREDIHATFVEALNIPTASRNLGWIMVRRVDAARADAVIAAAR